MDFKKKFSISIFLITICSLMVFSCGNDDENESLTCEDAVAAVQMALDNALNLETSSNCDAYFNALRDAGNACDIIEIDCIEDYIVLAETECGPMGIGSFNGIGSFCPVTGNNPFSFVLAQ